MQLKFRSFNHIPLYLSPIDSQFKISGTYHRRDVLINNELNALYPWWIETPLLLDGKRLAKDFNVKYIETSPGNFKVKRKMIYNSKNLLSVFSQV